MHLSSLVEGSVVHTQSSGWLGMDFSRLPLIVESEKKIKKMVRNSNLQKNRKSFICPTATTTTKDETNNGDVILTSKCHYGVICFANLTCPVLN